ncbi:heterokaryon incompatibility protein-domain-containing protein [Nemania sp. FL0916]|nr:heterokaryon incompatibility protein-domain-containing protein [Nemania sp. FL0916]
MTPFVTQRGLKLWVDAVCINQEDVDERSKQVSFMDKIYKSSETVLVWLGKSTEQSDLAIDTLAEWKATTTKLKPEDNETWEAYRAAFSKASAGGLDLCGPVGSAPARAWLAILSVWQRPWWRRAWIVQEATALPCTETILFCGNRRTDLGSMRTILNMRYYLYTETDEHQFLMCSFEQGFADHLDILKTRLDHGQQSLIQILEHVRTYECHDKRDKVFATMNMASSVPRGTIRPDYTKPLSEVYIEVVRYLIKSSSDGHCLDFLSHVIRSTPDWDRLELPDAGIPTWVPDWRGPTVDILEFRRSTYPQTERSLYNACQGTQPQFEICGNQLHVAGLFVDTVTTTTAVATNTRLSDISIERSWLPDDGNAAYVAGGTMKEAYNHAMIADVASTDEKLHSSGQPVYNRGHGMDWDLIDSSVSDLESGQAHRRMLLLNGLKGTTIGRRMFTTEKGFVGLGPAATRVGDSICVLLGGQMMYALRPTTGGHHEFVGECYVHGLTDGEALKEPSSNYSNGNHIISYVLV